MNKTELRRLARVARRHGYFDYGSTLKVRCPNCSDMVEADYRPSCGPKMAQLDDAVILHLEDCTDR